jgi:hypothetical protein
MHWFIAILDYESDKIFTHLRWHVAISAFNLWLIIYYWFLF